MLLTLGDLSLRVLTPDDPELIVEATHAETEPAVWGPHPAGPYSLADARAALQAWAPDRGGQFSVGILTGDRLVGALGVMPDEPGSAELAYWVRPESRGRGIAERALRGLTSWALTAGNLRRVWLEIKPTNVASLRVAERVGYTFERRTADHLIWIRSAPEPG